jgi:hypothetical protein
MSITKPLTKSAKSKCHSGTKLGISSIEETMTSEIPRYARNDIIY